MSDIYIDGKKLLVADDEFIQAPEITIDDLDLSRDAQMEVHLKNYRRWEGNNSRTPLSLRYKRLAEAARAKHVPLDLSRSEFVNLMLETEVTDETTGELTCLASLIERRDGTITLHPLEGGRVVAKYLGTTVLDTSTSN